MPDFKLDWISPDLAVSDIFSFLQIMRMLTSNLYIPHKPMNQLRHHYLNKLIKIIQYKIYLTIHVKAQLSGRS